MRCVEFLTEDASVFLDAHNASLLLEARENRLDSVEVSLDLGLSTQTIDLSEWDCNPQELGRIAGKQNSVYIIENGTAKEIAVRNDIEYRLLPTGKRKAPALLIDGELMHQIKPYGPMEYARKKAAASVESGFRVLDIGTGLGYLAIACLERNAKQILSIERYPEVIELSRVNPWSQRLHEDERVDIVVGDVLEIVNTLQVDSFDSVIHDPPQIQLTPELYTSEFYHSISQIIKPGGRLCHYVGPQGFSYDGDEVTDLVRSRVQKNGFHSIEFLSHLQSIIATFGHE